MTKDNETEEAAMESTTQTLFVIAMVALTLVSMVTTYISVKDSILPEPTITVPLGEGETYDCAILALMLSIAIGLMLFAMKLAIVDGHRRLNLLGIGGLVIIAFISISFNMDVFYRIADHDFFIRYSNARMRQVYENYLTEAQAALTERRDTIRREIARQEGELEAEIQGLREAPEGYGPRAKEEDYRLTLLQKTAMVDLQAVDDALAEVREVDALLQSRSPGTIEDIQQLQDDLRATATGIAAAANIRLPEPVRLQSPLFTVFHKLFDWETVGFMEVFILLLAIILDLGDIIGYSLVPADPAARRRRDGYEPDLPGPEVIPGPKFLEGPNQSITQPRLDRLPLDDEPDSDDGDGSRPRRAGGSVRFRR